MPEAPKRFQSTPKPPQRPWRRASFSFGGSKNKEEAGRVRDVDKGLEAIYLQGPKEDLKTLSHVRRSRALRTFGWIVGVSALASAIAWAGIFFWHPNAPMEGAALSLTLDGPAAIGLGREETFTLSWSNASPDSVRDTELRLSVPPEFLVSSLVPPPTDAESLTWKLGLVGAGARGEIRIKGVFLGTIGDQTSLQAVGTYRDMGDGRPHQSLVVRPLVFGETVLSGSFRVPANVVAGDAVPVEYSVVNRGRQGLRGLRVRFSLPKGFSVNGSDQLEQPLGDLASGATGTIKFVGAFVAGSAGDAHLLARVGVPRADGSFLPLLESTSTFAVLAGDLGLHLVANGGDGDRTISPGDPLRITIEYENLSPELLSGVRLELGFESLLDGRSTTGTSLLDWKKMEDSSHAVSTTRTRIQTLVFDKTSIAALAALDPQERGSVDIAIPTLQAPSGTKDAIIRLTLQGTMATVGKDKSTRVIRTNPMSFRYRSDVSFDASARYFTEEGAPIGFGPLPPVVGKTTGYRIFWMLKKSLHELQTLEVSAALPASVSFGANSSTDAGILSYDPSSRTVRWTLNRMPDGVRELEAWFDVQLTPTDFDVGRFAQLIGESRFTATDSLLSEPIVRSRPPITTDLQDDEGARSKGVVKKK